MFSTPAAFDKAVDNYLEKCETEKKTITLTGMMLELGFKSRAEFDKAAECEALSDSVKRAKLLVEAEYERRLNGSSPTAAVFALKSLGWSDKGATEAQGHGAEPIKIYTVKDASPEAWPDKANGANDDSN